MSQKQKSPRLAFYDTKPYDKYFFDQANQILETPFDIKYLESKLNPDTAPLAKESEAVVAFVNDTVDETVIQQLYAMDIEALALRSAGYNNVDFKAAFEKVHIFRVPSYSPHAVAEHTMALLLALSRKTHKAYNRTRDFNFSLNGLIGFNLYEKTVGVIGTGQIGRIFIDICKGFGMNVIAYDPFPIPDSHIQYVSLDQLLEQSDIISLHCPLTEDTYHMLNDSNLSKCKDGVYVINTSRGALIESQSLLKALRSGKVAGAGLDVYEEETDLFFEDFSNVVMQDEVLALLVSMPNVIVTSHQAFFTKEALTNIAETTLANLSRFFAGQPLENEICYQCTTQSPGTFCSQSDPSCRFTKNQ